MKLIKYLIYLILFTLILLIALYLFRNKIISAAGEKYLSRANGALVEIKGFDNRIFSLDIHIDALNVADKEDEYKNLIEVEDVNFTPRLRELLAGKIIIDEMIIKELRLDRKRQKSGKLPDNWKKNKDKKESKLFKNLKIYLEDKVEAEKEKITILNLEGDENREKVEEILELLDLNLMKEYEKSLETVEAKIEYLKGRVKEDRYKNDLKALEARIKNLDYDFKKIEKIKNFEDFERERKTLEAKLKEAEDIVREGKRIASMVEEDKDIIEKELKEIDSIKDNFINTAKDDYSKIKTKASFDKGAVLDLSIALLGEDATKQLIYLGLIYEKLVNTFDKEEISSEVEGSVSVKIDKMPHLPKLWIKKINLNYVKETSVYKGTIKNVSTDQKKTGKETIIDFEKEDKASFYIVYDNRDRQNKVDMDIFVNGIKLKDKTVKSDNMNLRAKLEFSSKEIKGNIEAELNDIWLDSGKILKKEKYSKILDRVAEDIRDVIIGIDIFFSDSEKIFKVKSDLDKAFSRGFRKIIEEEMEEFRRKIENSAQKEVDKYIDKLIGEIEKESAKIGLPIDEEDKKILMEIKELEDLDSSDEALDAIEKKLEERLKKKLEKELEEKAKRELDKLGDDLKDWLKF